MPHQDGQQLDTEQEHSPDEGGGLERSEAQGGQPDRRVVELGEESIGKMRARGLSVGPGDFAENVTVSGISYNFV